MKGGGASIVPAHSVRVVFCPNASVRPGVPLISTTRRSAHISVSWDHATRLVAILRKVGGIGWAGLRNPGRGGHAPLTKAVHIERGTTHCAERRRGTCAGGEDGPSHGGLVNGGTRAPQPHRKSTRLNSSHLGTSYAV